MAIAIAPPELFAGIVCGLLLAAAFCRRLRVSFLKVPGETLLLLITWFFLPLAILTAVSLFTATKIFIPRYYLFALPAFALLVGWLLSALQPGRARVIVGVSVILAAVSTFGGLWRAIGHGREDWGASGW